MITYVVEIMDGLYHPDGVWENYKDMPTGYPEYQYGKRVYEGLDLQEAKAVAEKTRLEVRWWPNKDYVTLDKYEDGKLIEALEF